MTTPDLRVLIAEKGFTETGITLRALCAESGRSLELYFVSKGASVGHALQTYGPDAALLDLSLLQPDPAAAVRVLHQNASRIPLIIFAAPADKESAVMCLQAGAKDYMLEGHMDVRTLDRVLHAALCGPQSDSRVEPARDPLTGLSNRSGLLFETHRRLPFAPPTGGCLMISISLQNLEAIQADSGLAAADRILQELGRLLQKSVRSSDLVAHVAPGQFALIILDAGDSRLAAINQRIMTRVSQYKQSAVAGIPLALSLFSDFARGASLTEFHEFLQALPGGNLTAPQFMCASSG